MEPEAIDDAQLLSAIERAWPVPPMTGQLINRDISSLAIEPQSGSFSAPLAMPRVKTRRKWSSLTRIAAVIALLLTSVFGVLAFNNRGNGDHPSLSIAAPSPYESACALPVRSRKEIVEIVKEVKEKIASGEEDGLIEAPYVSIYELTVSDSEVTTTVETLFDEANDCIQAGTNFYTLQMVSAEIYTPAIATFLNQANQSVETVVSDLVSPMNEPSTSTADYKWEIPALKTFITADGNIFAVGSVDIFGNGMGSKLQRNGDSWSITGYGTLRGEWSTLVMTSNSYTPSCSPTSIQSEEVMKQYLLNLGWNEHVLPLVATQSSARLENPAASDADADAIKTVVENYRDCLGAGIEPYRFAQGSEAFFGIFASYAHAVPSSPIDLLGLSSPGDLAPVMPSAITSIVTIETDKALAVLATDSVWAESGKVPAIILVNVDGQWLINQLAIVEGPPS